MQSKSILVTGGAGFIGSFLVDALIHKGKQVRVLDNLEPQVHSGKKPLYLNPQAEFIKGDVSNYKVFEKALEGIDTVFHLAARVGVAQSNYLVKEYTNVNIGGMANLLDIIANKKTKIKKILMTASMTSYGEGFCLCKNCGIVQPDLRIVEQLAKQDWHLYCPKCKSVIIPKATTESAHFNNNSIYALTKNVQEQMLLLIGKMYKIPVVSLRCFNVYGPRQSLSNPYTGVTAIFISRLKNNHQPIIYEDGLQTRDFISVYDVVDALIKAMENTSADYQTINIASGTPTSIQNIAQILAKLLKKDILPQITATFRKNDIRSCFADISKAKKLLKWSPGISLEQGLADLIAWSKKEHAVDLFSAAEKELRKKNLL